MVGIAKNKRVEPVRNQAIRWMLVVVPRMTDVMFAITKATCQLRQKVSEGRTWMSFLVLLESVGMGLMDTAEEKQSICDSIHSIHSIPPK